VNGRALPFILAASDHGSMIVPRTDFHQLENGGIYGVGAQILGQGCYDPAEVALLISVLGLVHTKRGNGLIALDCGANIGVFTLEMAREMLGWGHVYAFEAQERLYYALCGNIVLNNLFNASAMNVVLGREPGLFKIPRPNYNLPASFGSLELRKGPDTEYIGQNISYAAKDLADIRMFSIDSLKLPRTDLIKIDVEGMELEVLEGALSTIQDFRPILHIEWIKCGLDAIKDLLTPLGYAFQANELNVLALPEEFQDAS
jgi:FkbM family methyltransferase